VADHERTHVPFLVDRDEAAVGMAWLVITERIPGPEKWRRRSGHLQSVYVRPDHRNDGLGSLMIRTLIEAAESEELSYLSVHPSPRSFPFYRRLGFSGEGDLLIRYLGSTGTGA
jgi:GNAT superfamily N-acetyltransferase